MTTLDTMQQQCLLNVSPKGTFQNYDKKNKTLHKPSGVHVHGTSYPAP